MARFTGLVVEAGVRAVFGFPLHVGVVRLGSLNLYANDQGRSSTTSMRTRWSWRTSPPRQVLVQQAKRLPGSLATALEADADFQYVVTIPRGWSWPSSTSAWPRRSSD